MAAVLFSCFLELCLSIFCFAFLFLWAWRSGFRDRKSSFTRFKEEGFLGEAGFC